MVAGKKMAGIHNANQFSAEYAMRSLAEQSNFSIL